MNLKHLIIAAASSFALLLIIGVIFAIKAEPASEDTGPAPTNSLPVNSQSQNPQPANSQTVNNSPLNSTLATSTDPTAAGYTILASADSGYSLFAQKSDATTVQSAIIAALHDLTHILDSKPTVQGAFADAQQQHRGGATFTGTYKGNAIKGNIMCGIGDKGAAISILFDRADAPAADWAKLTAAIPLDTQMQEQSIGDGAGTITIPADWKITNSNNLGTVIIDGPTKQKVSLGLGLEVVTPDSVAAGVQRQLAESGQLTPATRLLVAPFTGPVDALKISRHNSATCPKITAAHPSPSIRFSKPIPSPPSCQTARPPASISPPPIPRTANPITCAAGCSGNAIR